MAQYKTKQRAQVVECLKENKDKHMTVEMLIKYLSNAGVSVGRATIYRTLDMLCKEGIIRRYELTVDNSACYQYIDEHADCSEHFHLKCEKCGELIHLDCDHITELSKHIEKDHAFKVNNSKTVLYGLCAKCAGL
ncbi:MAG: transcriptional repressor [Oscillospiraceae bacterium]|nr:transcriptional repressor [Oscillospiraceae bacterium]